MNTFATLAGLMITASIALCQPKDVDGWDNIKWGMTVAEAETALGSQVSEPIERPSDDGTLIGKAIVKDVRIADVAAQLTIQTKSNSDVVSGLEITAVWPGTSIISPDPPSALRTFLRLRTFLTEQYGRPKSEDRNRSDGRGHIVSTVVWSFPSTSITLLSTETAELRIGYVKVRYAAVEGKSANAPGHPVPGRLHD